MEGETEYARAVRRVRFVSRAILLLGAAAALAIFIASGSSDPEEFRLERSKKVAHDMEVIGGRANLLASDFREWFDGLWRGRNLAYTVAVLTILTVLVYRFFAVPLPKRGPGAPSGDPPTT